MEPKPLLRLLTEAGLGSRRGLADAIRQGRVQIDGHVAESFRQPVDSDRETVTVDGEAVLLEAEPMVYLMLNKPAGVLSTTRDERGRKTAIDTLPQYYRNVRLYPAGRLDSDSKGLLLLTNDGDLTYKLTHPRFEHQKEYLISVAEELEPAERAMLEQGIQLEDGMTQPAVVKKFKGQRPFNYSITLHEGRKRQVRRMFERIGHPALALKRVRIGSLRLGSLKEGQARRLTLQEIKALKQSAGARQTAPGHSGRNRAASGPSQKRLTGRRTNRTAGMATAYSAANMTKAQ